MRVSVFGLGYVGCVSAACLARDGHTVIGVDVDQQKVAAVASGRSPVIERGLDQLIAEVTRAGKLRATLDSKAAVGQTDVRDRKSTRLNSSHLGISYAVFCLKKKTV